MKLKVYLGMIVICEVSYGVFILLVDAARGIPAARGVLAAVCVFLGLMLARSFVADKAKAPIDDALDDAMRKAEQRVADLRAKRNW